MSLDIFLTHSTLYFSESESLPEPRGQWFGKPSWPEGLPKPAFIYVECLRSEPRSLSLWLEPFTNPGWAVFRVLLQLSVSVPGLFSVRKCEPKTCLKQILFLLTKWLRLSSRTFSVKSCVMLVNQSLKAYLKFLLPTRGLFAVPCRIIELSGCN